jgi:D,D-heptose 1,7-bisphosphate phosphatase
VNGLPLRQRAVFIDRDGTLNVHDGYIRTPAALQVFDFAGPAVRRLNDAGWLAVVVTNQGILARGECSLGTMHEIHRKLQVAIALSGARLDGIYLCPHHPDVPVPGGPASACRCRKPMPGLLLRAANELGIDLGTSWMIGDATTDIAAGSAAGARTVLVQTGVAGRDGKCPIEPDRTAADFAVAIDLILNDPG